VLVAGSAAAWERGFLAAVDRSSSPLTVARRCVDIVDLLAVAAAGSGRAALVDAGLRRLDADAVDRLHACGVVPVAVVPRGDPAAEDRMRALGVLSVVPADADPSVIVSVVVDAVEGTRTGYAAGPDRAFADPSSSLPVPPGDTPVPPAEMSPAHGSVIAVWGPTGAPGRTTVAVTLADELARLGRQTLLVDADVYGGTVAPALGLLDEAPGLAAACRSAGTSRLDGAGLAGLCWQLRPELRVLTGLPLASRWPELRPAALRAVLAAARALADVTVVDCGFCLEADEELSFDTLAPRRNGATLAVLDDADRIVVVGAADPIGMQRLVRALGELRDAEVPAAVDVVLNKVRKTAVPGDTERELVAALRAFAGLEPVALLPYDRESLDVAVANGRSVGEARPASPLRRAVTALADELTGELTGSAAARSAGARPGGRRQPPRARRSSRPE
jgi:MinD-like ATPase involved in chromosome partitioning or flagellar assembly